MVGAFGEGSEDLHNLVQKLAESKVGAMGLRSGREATDEEVGIVVGQLRRSLSTTFVRAQAQCLISRLQCIGKGYTEAAKRRKWAEFEDEKIRQMKKPCQQRTISALQMSYLYEISNGNLVTFVIC